MRNCLFYKTLWAVVIHILFSNLSFGQIIIDDNFSKELILKKSQMLSAENAGSDEEVYSGNSSKEFKAFSDDLIAGETNETWFRFTVKNSASAEKEIFIGGNDFEELSLFSEQVLKKKKDFPLIPFFKETFSPGQQKAYFLKGKNKSQSNFPHLKYPFQILSTEQFIKEYEAPKSYGYIALGAAVLLAFYHLLLFFVTRDRPYLFYCLFIAAVTFFSFSLSPYFAEMTYGEMAPTSGVPTVMGLLSLIFNIFFFRSIFKVKEKFPKWDRLLTYAIYAAIVSGILNMLGMTLISTVINIPVVLASTFLMAWLNYRMLDGKTLAPYFFFAGYLVFALSTAVLAAMLLGFLPNPFLGLALSTHFQLLITIGLVLLATALGARINQMQKQIIEEAINKEKILREQEAEKRQILESQNKELEEKVAIRANELEEQSSALETSIEQLKITQTQLVESEKMASLGQLTAGVAHEINNPINFVANGISNLKLNYNDLKDALANFMTLTPDNATPEKLKEILEKNKKLEVEYAIEDVQTLFKSINNGVDRTTKIARGLSSISSNESGEFSPSDINQNLDSTIEILKNNFKNKIEIVREYGELPPIHCEEGKINQVFLNIINNAGQAIKGDGKILIRTEYFEDKKEALIQIKDTGAGMSDEVRKKIFDPFFTTKDVGIGTGLGLSITYGIIEEHNGRIEVQSEEGKGTTFSIYLPENN